MTISSGRISVVCFAIANLVLLSCADQPELTQDISNLVREDSRPQADLAVVKPLAPNVASGIESTVPIPSRVTEGSGEPAAQIHPPTSISRKNSSSPPTPDISELIGLDSIGLNLLLGKPILVRREAEAEVWQYRTANCALHLFLYRDAINKLPYQVVHMEANHRRRIDTVLTSFDLNSLEQKNLIKFCFDRLFYQANISDNPR